MARATGSRWRGATFRTANPRVSFDRNGTYIATLFVTDPAGAEDSASLMIVIGNEPPVVSVNVATTNKTFYTPGAPIAYSVEVSDKEDGKLAAGQVALGIDYVPEGFDARDIALGRTEVGPTTRFAVAKALMAKSDCLQCHVPRARACADRRWRKSRPSTSRTTRR